MECHRCIAEHGRFIVALSGGNTPKRFFQLLASPEFSNNISWKKVFLFWSDERFVPHSDPESNYRMAKENLLDYISIPKKNIYPTPVKSSPKLCAAKYEASIKEIFADKEFMFDWIMEPVAVKLGYWQWESNSIPLYNYISWIIISAGLLTVFRKLNQEKPNIFAVHLFIIQVLFFVVLRTFL